MPKSGKLESHTPFGGILKAKRNFKIVCERAMFKASRGRVGGVVGSSWRGSCIWHASACRIPVGGDTPICVKSLFLRFLKAPVTLKLKPAETNEYVKLLMLPSPSCGPCLVGMASTPSGQHSWLYKRSKQLYLGEFLSLKAS